MTPVLEGHGHSRAKAAKYGRFKQIERSVVISSTGDGAAAFLPGIIVGPVLLFKVFLY